MTKTKREPAVAVTVTALTKTFTLARPIADDDGRSYATLTIAEPRLLHKMQVQRRQLTGAAPTPPGSTVPLPPITSAVEGTIALMALLASVPESAIRKLKMRDAEAIRLWIETRNSEGVKADEQLTADDALAAGEHTFVLLSPVETNTAQRTHITVREPDLEAAIAMESRRTEAERMAALIASLSDWVIPEVQRLAQRDVDRIERWLGFFSPAGAD